MLRRVSVIDPLTRGWRESIGSIPGLRRLPTVGCGGIGIADLLAGYAYRAHLPGVFVLTLTLSAIAFYAVSLAPVTWVVISEIFPNRLRSAGVSTAVASLWASSFLLTYSYRNL